MPKNGVSEEVPVLTYITVNPPDEDPKFIDDAKAFHREWRLKPITIGSFEHMINDLALNRNNVKSRVRLVAHASFDSIKVPFFDGGPQDAWRSDFVNAFATNEVQGLHHVIGDFPITVNGSPALPLLLGRLRQFEAPALRPFGLDVNDPADVLEDFFMRILHLGALNNMLGVADAGLRAIIRLYIDAIDAVLDGRRMHMNRPEGFRRILKELSAEKSMAQVDSLTEAIEQHFPPSLHLDELALRRRAPSVRAAPHGITRRRFGKRLEQARKRFDDQSAIDIRGCTVGGDLEFLKAISRLFTMGLPGPRVSAPTLFQIFASANSRRLKTPTDIVEASVQPLVDQEARHWCEVTGNQNFLAMLPATRLASYLDEYVLPVGSIVGPVAVNCDLLLFAPNLSGTPSFIAPSGSSGHIAMTDWLLDQWQLDNIPNKTLRRQIERAGKSFRTAWKNGTAPPFAGATDLVHTFVAPDPTYAGNIATAQAA